MIYRIAILGPQGSGKGTQGELLAKFLKLPLISTGDLYREEIEKKTSLGNLIKNKVVAGKLVADNLTNHLISVRLSQADCQKGFILDGYPRNVVQLGFLEGLAPLTHVIVLEIDDKTALKRLLGRRICPRCGRVYHLQYNRPLKDTKCDVCQIKLVRRADDYAKAIKERLKIYHQETEPILNFYKGKGVLYSFDARPSILSVFKKITKIFQRK